MESIRASRPDGPGDPCGRRDFVCSLNQRLVDGIVRGLGNETLGVVMEPGAEECCVVLEPPTPR